MNSTWWFEPKRYSDATSKNRPAPRGPKDRAPKFENCIPRAPSLNAGVYIHRRFELLLTASFAMLPVPCTFRTTPNSAHWAQIKYGGLFIARSFCPALCQYTDEYPCGSVCASRCALHVTKKKMLHTFTIDECRWVAIDLVERIASKSKQV